MKNIKISEKEIGINHRPYFIADIAANHDGDIERAFKLIELAKDAGADAAKFQNFQAPNIVSDKGFEKMGSGLSHQKNWSKSVFQVYQEASIPDEWSPLLKEKCVQCNIEYMTSPYDFHSVDIANKYVNCFKIGSGDITWTDIVEYIAQKEKPVLLATGASSISDVDRAMSAIMKWNHNIVLMQCNTNYTGSENNFNHINLNVLKLYHKKYPDAILGLSDHTFGYATILGAIALGGRVFEKHFTDDVRREGPDHRFSMTPPAFKEMVTEANHLFNALGNGIKQVEENEYDTNIIQRRALYLRVDKKAGDLIKEDDVYPLRPAVSGSIAPYELKEIIGKRLKNNLLADTYIKWEDISYD